MTTRIIIDVLAMFILCGIAYGVGYKAGKRFAVSIVTQVLVELKLDKAQAEPRGLTGRVPPVERLPSPAARVIGAIVGRPAGRVQDKLDTERPPGWAKPAPEVSL